MTPEEHIELAERIIDNYRNDTDALKAAEIHVRIAEFKKRYPSDAGRPVARSRVRATRSLRTCPATFRTFGTGSNE